MRRRPWRVSGRQHLEERTKTQRNKGRPPGAPCLSGGIFVCRAQVFPAGGAGGARRGAATAAGEKDREQISAV